jgi:hypothetical protein
MYKFDFLKETPTAPDIYLKLGAAGSEKGCLTAFCHLATQTGTELEY